MKEIQENILRFVAQHWKAGRFGPERAWRHFRATGKATGPGRRPAFGRPVWGYAFATALAAVAVGLFLFHKTPITVIPAAADIQAAVLPDGTRATLAPGATLSFRRHGFGRRDRSVSQTGKIFYAVVRNEAVPFEITADKGFVRVLGTRFQVETDSLGTAVDVVDGRVLFAHAPDRRRLGRTRRNGLPIREKDGIVLTRGMHAELPAGAARPVLSDPKTANPAAWASLLFRYEDTPLEKVLQELSAQSGRAYFTDQPDRRLTGEFEGSEPDEIISLIEEALDLKISRR